MRKVLAQAMVNNFHKCGQEHLLAVVNLTRFRIKVTPKAVPVGLFLVL